MSTQDRRSFLAAASSLAIGLVLPATAGAATVNPDFGAKMVTATLGIVNAVAGGSAAVSLSPGSSTHACAVPMRGGT